MFQRALAPGNGLPARPRTLLSSNPLSLDIGNVASMSALDLHWGRGCGLAAALILGAVQTCAADGLRAGQWRTINSPEIDGVAGPVQQTTRCLTPEAVADLDKTFSPISRTTNSTCCVSSMRARRS